MLADGIAGFCESIPKFDLSQNNRLQTYSGYWIINAIGKSNLLDDQIRLPNHQKQNLCKINAAKAELIRQGISEPTEQQLHELSKVPLKHIAQLRDYLGDSRYSSIHYKIDLDENNRAVFAEDLMVDPSSLLQQAQVDTHIDLTYLLDLLPPMHKFVLSRSYGIPEQLSLEEIGKHFDKSREYMRIIRDIALYALQKHVELSEQDEHYRAGNAKANVALLINHRNRDIVNASTESKRRNRNGR